MKSNFSSPIRICNSSTIFFKIHLGFCWRMFFVCGLFTCLSAVVAVSAFATETITVSANGFPVQSPVLLQGHSYNVTASGLYYNRVVRGWQTDAAGYGTADAWAQSSVTYLNCYMDGDDYPWTDFAFNSSHQYTKTIIGKNERIGFWIVDNPYTDNSGGLTVTFTDISSPTKFLGDDKIPKTPDSKSDSAAEPVNLATGAFYTEKNLITLHGARDLDLVISYNSRLLGENIYSLGDGWSHNFEASVQRTGDAAVVSWNASRYNSFAAKTPGGSVFIGTDDAVKYDLLTQLGDGTWLLKKQNGERLMFATDGVLVRTEDRFGRALVIAYDYLSIGGYYNTPVISSITEPVSGKSLTFGHFIGGPGGGSIASISSSDGRQVLFSYYSYQMYAVTIRSADGNESARYNFTYDAGGRLLTAGDPDGTYIINTYDDSGRIASQLDGASPALLIGNTLIPAKPNYTNSFTYDDTNAPGYRITTMKNRNGATSVHLHDSNLQPVVFIDELGRTNSYSYDLNGNRHSQRDPLGGVTAYKYNANGNTTRIIDANSNVKLMAYDGANNLVATTNANGETQLYAYSTNNLLLSSTDARGNQTTYQYNSNSLLKLIVTPNGGRTDITYSNGLPATVSDANGNVTQYLYDPAGRLTNRIDPDGYHWSFGYDILDNLTAIQDPMGNTTTRTCNYLGKKTRETDPLGKTTKYFYDANNNLRAISNALGGITVLGYDPEDRNTSVIDALGRTNLLVYDAAGQLAQALNPLNNSHGFSYDANGNLQQEMDALGRPIYTNAYSPINQITGVSDALGNATRFNLDAVGRRIGQTDPLGRIQSFSFDKNGRLVAVQTPLNAKAAQAYDSAGNRTAITNAAGAGWTYAYDLGGRMTNMTSPMGRKTAFGYNARNLPSSLTKPSGQQTAFAYDAAQRLIQSVDPVGTIVYGYDNKGRLLTVTENGKTITREYDALDRITRYVDVYSNEIRYAYDAVGNLTNLTYPGSQSVQYAYDAANRMTTVRDWTGRTTSFSYDTNGLLAQITRPNNTREVRVYDANQRLQLLAELDASGSAAAQTVLTWDAAGQLTGEAVTPTPAFFMPPQAQMTYDLDDRLTSWNGQPVSSDVDGNSTTAPLAQGISSLTFDARNRLVATPAQNFEYDAEGRRVAVCEAGITNRFVNNPNAPLSQVLMQTSSSGSSTYYIYGPDGLLYALDGTSAKYYQYDIHGNTVATIDDSGATIARFAYSPFGQVQSQPAGVSELFLFDGQNGVQTDTSGLLYMRARYYSPFSGRFVSEDRLFGMIENVASLNRYAYASGNPIMFNDPEGQYNQYQVMAGVWNLYEGIGVLKALPKIGMKALKDLKNGKDIMDGKWGDLFKDTSSLKDLFGAPCLIKKGLTGSQYDDTYGPSDMLIDIFPWGREIKNTAEKAVENAIDLPALDPKKEYVGLPGYYQQLQQFNPGGKSNLTPRSYHPN